MATVTLECVEGFALGIGSEVKTQRGNTRVFGAGTVYTFDSKDLKSQIAAGWLQPVDRIPEKADANPGEKRSVPRPPSPDARAGRKEAADAGDVVAEQYAKDQIDHRHGEGPPALTPSQKAEAAELEPEPKPKPKPAAKKAPAKKGKK